MQDLNKTSVE